MSLISIIVVFVVLFLRVYQDIHCSTSFPSVLQENSISDIIIIIIIIISLNTTYIFMFISQF
jgi:hypothetical protein